MYELVLKFLLKWWKEILIALVVVGAIWYVRHLQTTVEEQAVTITRMEVANQVLTDSNKTLTATVTVNNKTIEELSKGANQTKQAFDKLNAHVEQQTAVLSRRLTDIMKQKAPVTCDDTIKYMIEAAPTYKQ